MKNKIKSVFAVIIVCIAVTGCETKKSHIQLSFETPPCIYYEDKIYWEDAIIENVSDVDYLDEVKYSVNDNDLPNENFYVNSTGKSFVNSKVFKKDNSLYIKNEDGYHQFVYYDQMRLEKEDVLSNYENRTEKSHDPDAIRLHFVYKGMRYFILGEKPNENDLKSFKQVGKIKSNVSYASKDYSGNIHIGDLLYASDHQNRYMIVQNKTDGLYEYYENQAYFKCSKIR